MIVDCLTKIKNIIPFQRVSIPNNFRNDTAAQIPILAKNPSATAVNTKVETNLKIFTAYFPHKHLKPYNISHEHCKSSITIFDC